MVISHVKNGWVAISTNSRRTVIDNEVEAKEEHFRRVWIGRVKKL